MAYYRESYPRSLTDWRLYRSNANGFAEPSTVGTEFSGRDAPKLKFLFTVEFLLSDTLRNFVGASDRAGQGRQRVNEGSSNMGAIQYACKSATRPNISVNMVEVNSYNYRFKVGTRTDYGTVSLTLYDDNKNYAHSLFLNYLNLISPISNRVGGLPYYAPGHLQEWASLGPLPNNDKDGLIKKMRITHHYSGNYIDDPYSHRMIHYDYINPKIQSFALDDLDMSISDANLINLNFVYDSVNVSMEGSLFEEETIGRVEVGPVEQI